MARSVEEPSWSQEPCLRIGKALLDAPDRTLTAKEITARGGGSNVARSGAKLISAGLLEEREPPPDSDASGPGRPSEKAYHLPDDQITALEDAVKTHTPPGQLAPTQQLVHVAADDLARLFVALDVSVTVATSAWFYLSDGQPPEYVIAFTGDDCVARAQDLAAELQAAGLTARRGPVTQVGDAATLAAQARSAATEARKATMRGVA
jgi:hypothetical protein